MGENPLLQKLGNIKNGDALYISPQFSQEGGSTGDNRLILLLSNSEKSIAQADLLQTSLGELRKVYLACAPWHDAEEKNRSSPGGVLVLSARQEKGPAGAQVQLSLFLQDSGAA